MHWHANQSAITTTVTNTTQTIRVCRRLYRCIKHTGLHPRCQAQNNAVYHHHRHGSLHTWCARKSGHIDALQCAWCRVFIIMAGDNQQTCHEILPHSVAPVQWHLDQARYNTWLMKLMPPIEKQPTEIKDPAKDETPLPFPLLGKRTNDV